jgi:hypothetical protein
MREVGVYTAVKSLEIFEYNSKSLLKSEKLACIEIKKKEL